VHIPVKNEPGIKLNSRVAITAGLPGVALEAGSKLGGNGKKRPGEHVLLFAGNAAVSAAKSVPIPHSVD
jgi:hypothetical protein